jgi:hypothetical protein
MTASGDFFFFDDKRLDELVARMAEAGARK